jgi:hypothetical protein
MKTCIAWLLLVLSLLLTSTSIEARSACIPVHVQMDDKLQSVDISMDVPSSVTRIPLQNLEPNHRTSLWTSPDHSTRIEEDAIQATSGQRPLHMRMDLTQPPDRKDRAYAPFLRFADGTVALDSQLFLAADNSSIPLCPRYFPGKGQEVIGFGQVQTTPLEAGSNAPAGYVAFGSPYVQRSQGLLFVSDTKAPVSLRERIATQAPLIVSFYASKLGKRDIPTVFLFAVPNHPGIRNFNGDHLPSSITLGLYGSGWDGSDNDAQLELTGFLAHELFHVWNSAPELGSPEGEALIAKEGGAELARIMMVGMLNRQSPGSWLDQIASTYNACLFDLPQGVSIATALKQRTSDRLSYLCGVPVMFALAVANNPQNPVEGYFDLWKKLERQHRIKHIDGYNWTDLMPARIDAALRNELTRAIRMPDAYATAMQEALNQVGIHSEPLATLNADDSRQYAGAIVAHLMRQDCGGSVSFWINPDGFLIDKTPVPCKALKSGSTVNAILGQSLSSADMLVLAKAVFERCAKGHTVEVGYTQGSASGTSEVICSKPMPPLPRPLRFSESSFK